MVQVEFVDADELSMARRRGSSLIFLFKVLRIPVAAVLLIAWGCSVAFPGPQPSEEFLSFKSRHEATFAVEFDIDGLKFDRAIINNGGEPSGNWIIYTPPRTDVSYWYDIDDGVDPEVTLLAAVDKLETLGWVLERLDGHFWDEPGEAVFAGESVYAPKNNYDRLPADVLTVRVSKKGAADNSADDIYRLVIHLEPTTIKAQS